MSMNEIWGSSQKHQTDLNKIHQQTSKLRKALGLYKIPSDFPFTSILWQKLPIVYNNRFSFEIMSDGIKLIPNNDGLMESKKNINLHLTDPIFIKEVISISRYENSEPFMKAFNIKWIQIKFYNEQKAEEEILLCVGGKSMSTMVSETDKLFEIIRDKFPKG